MKWRVQTFDRRANLLSSADPSIVFINLASGGGAERSVAAAGPEFTRDEYTNVCYNPGQYTNLFVSEDFDVAGQRNSAATYYKLKKPSMRWGAQASRLALNDQLKLKPSQRKHPKRILAATAHLMGRWKGRQSELREAGWSDVEDPKDYKFSLSCPPIGVTTDKIGIRVCRHQRICPWCWCRRYVIEVFEKFQALILPSPLKKQKKYDICWIEDIIRLPVTGHAVTDGIEWWQEHRRDYLQKELKESVGTFVLLTIEPPDRHHAKPSYLMRRRIVTALPWDVELPAFDACKCHSAKAETGLIKRYAFPGRGKLAESVANVCKYPASLMKGSASDVVRILEESKGTKMSSTFGGLRGKPNPKRGRKPR